MGVRRDVLRVPLYGECKLIVGHFDAFDDAIIGMGHDAYIGRGIVNALVMDAVDAHLLAPHDTGQQRAVFDQDTVHDLMTRFFRHIEIVALLGINKSGDVLVQCAAQGNVHHLAASADTQNGLVISDSPSSEYKFRFIPLGICRLDRFVTWLVVIGRVNVLATGQ